MDGFLWSGVIKGRRVGSSDSSGVIKGRRVGSSDSSSASKGGWVTLVLLGSVRVGGLLWFFWGQ